MKPDERALLKAKIEGRDLSVRDVPSVTTMEPCGLLTPFDMAPLIENMLALGVVTPEELARRDFREHRAYRHEGPIGGKPGKRQLVVQVSVEVYDLEDSFARLFGIRKWRHASVSVKGALDIRLADQRQIGRKRRPGERSPAPLPDWYELTHLAYGHAAELGFDPDWAVWQYLPGRFEQGLNIAEALHLRQPA
ncbi:MAG: hypothetical protein ACOYB2_10770 [Limnohabitans sp.]